MESPTFVLSNGQAVVNVDQMEAMFRMLIDSGDMTPMARLQLRKLIPSTSRGSD